MPYLHREIINNSDFQQTISMDKRENEERFELKDLLEELSQLDTPVKVIAANKPWWLQEENLLGEIDLEL